MRRLVNDPSSLLRSPGSLFKIRPTKRLVLFSHRTNPFMDSIINIAKRYHQLTAKKEEEEKEEKENEVAALSTPQRPDDDNDMYLQQDDLQATQLDTSLSNENDNLQQLNMNNTIIIQNTQEEQNLLDYVKNSTNASFFKYTNKMDKLNASRAFLNVLKLSAIGQIIPDQQILYSDIILN